MADTVSPETRSRIMARVKSKGMKPEMQGAPTVARPRLSLPLASG